MFPSHIDADRHLRVDSVNQALQRSLERLEVDAFVVHDIRRTVATQMRELGVSLQDLKMVLNHARNDVTAHYDHYDGQNEKRRALERWEKS